MTAYDWIRILWLQLAPCTDLLFYILYLAPCTDLLFYTLHLVLIFYSIPCTLYWSSILYLTPGTDLLFYTLHLVLIFYLYLTPCTDLLFYTFHLVLISCSIPIPYTMHLASNNILSVGNFMPVLGNFIFATASSESARNLASALLQTLRSHTKSQGWRAILYWRQWPTAHEMAIHIITYAQVYACTYIHTHAHTQKHTRARTRTRTLLGVLDKAIFSVYLKSSWAHIELGHGFMITIAPIQTPSFLLVLWY
jgi:hypothetical protein